MGAAAVPLLIATTAATTVGSVLQSQAAKEQMESEAKRQKRQAKESIQQQKEEKDKQAKTATRDEERRLQRSRAAGASGRPGTIQTTPLGIIDNLSNAEKTVLGR